MKEPAYIQQRDELFDTCMNSDFIHEDKILNRTYQLVSAHLLNFCPSISTDRHEELFRKMIFHQKLSVLDTQLDNIMGYVMCEAFTPEVLNLLRNQAAIICTFHMGSMRLLNHLLAANKIPFSLVLADTALHAEGALFKDMFNQFRRTTGHEDAYFDIIAANRPDAGIKMLGELRKGRSLLVYVDGNTGAGNDSIRNENRQKISFLSQAIYARKGTAFLAYTANVPLITAICYRKKTDDIRIRFYDPLYPDKTISKNDFSGSALQQLYDSFSVLLNRYPEQWECWKYLHSIINPKEFEFYADESPDENGIIPQALKFNHSKFGLFNVDNDYYLFSKRSYEFFPIACSVYNMLKNATLPGNMADVMDNQLIKHFYKMSIVN